MKMENILNMNRKSILKIIVCTTFFGLTINAQIVDEDIMGKKKELLAPKSVDFSKMFEKEKMTREEFEDLKRQKEMKLRERISQIEALEKAVDQKKYIVGPGDIFSFNIWGAMEMQLPISVSPEGKLPIPSVGEIEVDGKSLEEVQRIVLEQASSFYEKSKITCSLEALRFFRVHVVGEVKYPGTYIAQAVDRISELITEAGGETDWAWLRRIELRRCDGNIHYFDMSSFKQEGNLEQDIFVNGGDIIYIPPIDIQKNLVKVVGDHELGGVYQIFPDEKLLDFLQRVRAMDKNSDLSKILVLRNQSDSKEVDYIMPFANKDSTEYMLLLKGDDTIVIPSKYVFVKGAVRNPGAYPFVMNLTAKDYAGMAGGDFRSGGIKKVKVYHMYSGKTQKGPDVPVEPGDVVDLSQSWGFVFRDYATIVSAVASIVLTLKYIGVFDQN
jgi:protein involved in polysaccharide export with SLBB domain